MSPYDLGLYIFEGGMASALALYLWLAIIRLHVRDMRKDEDEMLARREKLRTRGLRVDSDG